MIYNVDISREAILIAKMKALETQFMLPLYNPAAYALKRQTEIALGEVYLEIMGKKPIQK